MIWKIYLSGEIHTYWRNEIKELCSSLNLHIEFTNPVTDHELSDACGERILGPEIDKLWHDHKSAKINAIRTRTYIKQADIIIVKFGDKYKQWNVAFDAGFASALSKPLIIIHNDNNQHALKEIDAAAFCCSKEC